MSDLRRKRMLAAAVTIILAMCACSKRPELLNQLAAPATTETARNQLIKKCGDDPDLKAEIAKDLPAMLAQTPYDIATESEAELAGALKITSTIPELVQLLGRSHPPPPVHNLISERELRDDTIARALYEIGRPAYPALAAALNSPDKEKRARIMSILVLASYDHDKEAKQILSDHQSVEPDPHLRDYIAANLAWWAAHPQTNSGGGGRVPHP
jgi:hypothetical protein